MEYEDRLTIQTPEGLDLELSLAGVGSRFTAALLDFLIQNAIVIAAVLALVGVEVFAGGVSGLGGGIFALVLFFVIFGYDVLFEVFASGRTPGKRATGIRVVQSGGEPVGFLTSAIRNALRLVDFLPFMYAVGIVSILATRRNQRLGDLAAGTLIVRERRHERRAAAAGRGRSGGGEADAYAAWDVSAITAEEHAAVRSFLERRAELDDAARADVARALAEALRAKVVAAQDAGDEAFLETVAAVKARRG